MSDIDPELLRIQERKKEMLRKRATFFQSINQDGVTHVTDENINELLKDSPLPVIVDFSADAWCRPCQVVAPIFEALSKEYKGKIVFLKINTDHNQRSATQYRIMSVPTFVIFYRQRPIARKSGAMPHSRFKAWIDSVLRKLL